MVLATKNKWLTVSALAIILPISLLATFKLTGIISEPQTPETITQTPIIWNMERPSGEIDINQIIENSYFGDNTLVNMSLNVYSYLEDASFSPYHGRDGIVFGVNLFVKQGSASCSSLVVRCIPMDVNSAIIISMNDWAIESSNAVLRKVKQSGTHNNGAYIRAEPSSSTCSLNPALIYWVFEDEDTEKHQLNVTTEVVYFNGTAHKRIVISALLLVWPDAGNEFETAKTIDSGVYIGSLHWQFDPEDFYAVTVQEGQVIDVRMVPQNPNGYYPNYDLYLYGPDIQLRDSSCSGGIIPERITFTSDSTGTWYIQVKHSLENSAHNQYLLNVNVSDDESGGAQ